MSAELEKGLRSKLVAAGTIAKSRIYPRLPQQPVFPAIRYQRIHAQRQQSLDANVGVTEVTMQVDCMADSYSDAKTLADEVRTALHGIQGAWGTLQARLVVLDSEIDFDEQDGDDITHWVMQRYRIWTNMD